MKILVIAAHPDDEVLGCGGTISKYIRQGLDVSIAILGEGMTSRSKQKDKIKGISLEKLHKASKKAGAVLGVTDITMFNLPDNRFDSLDLLDIVKKIETLIEEKKPQRIFTHHNGDLNIDHEITHRAVLTATRPVLSTPVKEIYSFEIPSSTEWAFNQFSGFHPNMFVNICDTINIKIAAMEAYSTETRPSPHPRSPENIKSLAQYRGASAGADFCEAFTLIRRIE